ncbi:MAG: hypothetical protein K6F33_15520, partial [Bacteroidales bacterium]|nr:hypothetical protein [Bacteroidales bacterium]
MSEILDNINEQDIADDAKLMAFFRGELSAQEEAEFKQRLQSDSALKARAIAVARLIKGLEKEGEQRDAATIKNGEKKSVVVKWVVHILAAAVLVGFAVFYGINEHNNQKL